MQNSFLQLAFAVITFAHNPFYSLIYGDLISLPVCRNNNNFLKKKIITYLTPTGVLWDVLLWSTDTSGTQHVILRPWIFVRAVPNCPHPTPYKAWKGRHEDPQLSGHHTIRVGDSSVVRTEEAPWLLMHRMPQKPQGLTSTFFFKWLAISTSFLLTHKL